MENTDLLWNLIKLAPVVILILIVFVGVFRGLSRKKDSANNRAKGGGLSNFDHWMGGD